MDRLLPQCDHTSGCITCGDEAIAMSVLSVDVARGLALCQTADGERESVETALVEPIAPGEGLLVHAGTAIARAPDTEPAAAFATTQTPLRAEVAR